MYRKGLIDVVKFKRQKEFLKNEKVFSFTTSRVTFLFLVGNQLFVAYILLCIKKNITYRNNRCWITKGINQLVLFFVQRTTNTR